MTAGEAPQDLTSPLVAIKDHTRPGEDDWRGITDQKERKKRQNRINQRIFSM